MPKIIFCRKCNNMTYPRIVRETSNLCYFCIKCQAAALGSENCVYHHQISHVPSESKMVVPELGADFTLPRNSGEKCPKCDAPEPVFFQSNSKHKETTMVLYYVCSRNKCSHRWNTKPAKKKEEREDKDLEEFEGENNNEDMRGNDTINDIVNEPDYEDDNYQDDDNIFEPNSQDEDIIQEDIIKKEKDEKAIENNENNPIINNEADESQELNEVDFEDYDIKEEGYGGDF